MRACILVARRTALELFPTVLYLTFTVRFNTRNEFLFVKVCFVYRQFACMFYEFINLFNIIS